DDSDRRRVADAQLRAPAIGGAGFPVLRSAHSAIASRGRKEYAAGAPDRVLPAGRRAPGCPAWGARGGRRQYAPSHCTGCLRYVWGGRAPIAPTQSAVNGPGALGNYGFLPHDGNPLASRTRLHRLRRSGQTARSRRGTVVGPAVVAGLRSDRCTHPDEQRTECGSRGSSGLGESESLGWRGLAYHVHSVSPNDVRLDDPDPSNGRVALSTVVG